MLNYEVDPDVLRPYLPTGTALDTWNGRHYISIVGLMFERTKLYGLPVPFHRTFEEVNLRFYVRREVRSDANERAEMRRGVVFIKEIVPRHAVTLTARAFYNENYITLPMHHDIRRQGDALAVRYEWGQRDSPHRLEVCVSGEPALLQDGTEEEFIAEHYWGYTRQRDGSTLEYEVEHPRWRVWRASPDNAALHCDVERVYGSEFAASLDGAPTSSFLAEGSPVVVRKGRRIT